MVDNPEERYPRAFTAITIVSAAAVLGSLGLAQWYARTVAVDADTLAIVGWALGAGAMMVMYRCTGWLDSREGLVARIERRLGGDT